LEIAWEASLRTLPSTPLPINAIVMLLVQCCALGAPEMQRWLLGGESTVETPNSDENDVFNGILLLENQFGQQITLESFRSTVKNLENLCV